LLRLRTTGKSGTPPTQNVAASNMTMAAPARIALVASTLGRPSAEGETMRLVGPIVGVALVIIVLGVLIGRAAAGM